MSKYQVRITGQKTGFNAHRFEGVFGFEDKDDADAFADFQTESHLVDLELEDVKVEKLYSKGCEKALTPA
jgi:hypothetical protein